MPGRGMMMPGQMMGMNPLGPRGPFPGPGGPGVGPRPGMVGTVPILSGGLNLLGGGGFPGATTLTSFVIAAVG